MTTTDSKTGRDAPDAQPEEVRETAGPKRCGRGNGSCKNPAVEPHGCPYQQEIYDSTDDEYCVCCDDCQMDCLYDI